MADTVTFEEVATMAAKLSPEDKKRLADQLVQDMQTGAEDHKKHKLKDLRGIMAYPMCGEDAQKWVSRTRGEWNEREKKWGHSS